MIIVYYPCYNYIDRHVIYFCGETARIAKPCAKDKHRPVVGMPIISVKIGDHCYHGLCDMGASASVIPIDLYEEIKEPVPVKEETILYNLDPVVPSTYIEKPPFLVRIKEHAKVSTVVNKSYIRTPKPDEQIEVEPSIAMVKDLLEEDMDGHVIYFCEEAARIANLIKRINLDLLLACALSQLK